MTSIQLQGKIFLQGTINALTGLHIGGNSGELDIGGIDNPVIRNASQPRTVHSWFLLAR